jgi:hypothetical protein
MNAEEYTFTDRYLKLTQLYTRNQNNCLRCQFPSVVERYFK